MNRIIALAIGMLALACYSTASQAAITSFTVNKATISTSTGAITVTGTIVCTAPNSFFINDDLVQVSGGKSVLARGNTSGACSGGTDTWTAPESVEFGSIKTGNADVVVFAMETGGSSVLQVFHQSVTPVP